MEGWVARGRWLAAAVALHASVAGAQVDASIATTTSTPTPISTSTPLDDAPLPPDQPASIRSGDHRWNLSFEFGPAAAGAPNGLLGFGVALGTIEGIRIETNVLLGFSASSESVAADPAWNASIHDYTGAEWTSRAVLFELAASRRQGAAEIWVGSGVHVSWAQWEASYSYLRCTDILCFGPKIPSSDSDVTLGSGGVGVLVGAGARLAILDRVLLGLSARWLGPATSHVGAPFDRDVRVGGLTVGVGLTLRLGVPVPR